MPLLHYHPLKYPEDDSNISSERWLGLLWVSLATCYACWIHHCDVPLLLKQHNQAHILSHLKTASYSECLHFPGVVSDPSQTAVWHTHHYFQAPKFLWKISECLFCQNYLHFLLLSVSTNQKQKCQIYFAPALLEINKMLPGIDLTMQRFWPWSVSKLSNSRRSWLLNKSDFLFSRVKGLQESDSWKPMLPAMVLMFLSWSLASGEKYELRGWVCLEPCSASTCLRHGAEILLSNLYHKKSMHYLLRSSFLQCVAATGHASVNLFP